MKKLLAGLAVLMLLGGGCPAAYVSGETPTEAQLDVMTDAQIKAGMDEMMKKHPLPQMTDEERREEGSKARQTTAEGTAERIADFESRAHTTNGMAKFVKQGDKWFIVFSDTFSTEAGPYLVVDLSANPNPTNRADLHAQGLVELGLLKSVSGGQMYEIPAGTDVAKFKSVVIYCKPFGVIFAVASVK